MKFLNIDQGGKAAKVSEMAEITRARTRAQVGCSLKWGARLSGVTTNLHKSPGVAIAAQA